MLNVCYCDNLTGFILYFVFIIAAEEIKVISTDDVNQRNKLDTLRILRNKNST